MKSFQVKDFDDPKRKPSLNSVIAYKERMAQLQNPPAEVEEEYTETEQKMMDEAIGNMSLVSHLSELRKRIVISAIAIIIGFSIAYYFIDDLMRLLIQPAGKLYYMKPTEAFFTYMKVALVAGIIGSSPIWLYECWAFIIPALTKREKYITNWFLPVAIVLFFIGVLFSYFLVLPAAIKFFIGFATGGLQPLFSIGQYIDFVIAMLLPFGVIFELPLILMGLAQIGLINSRFLKKQRKIFFLLAFIIGAIVSPTPDVFSQTMIAMPMIVLYEVSVFIVAKFMKK